MQINEKVEYDEVKVQVIDLRDYFAGQALAGVVGLCVNDARLANEKVEEMLARKAFLMADAMIEARNKKQEDSE